MNTSINSYEIEPVKNTLQNRTESELEQKLLDDSSKNQYEENIQTKLQIYKLKIQDFKLLRNTWFRFLLLFFICLMFLGAIMTQEYPSVLEDYILEQMFGYDPHKDRDNLDLKKSAQFKYSLMFIVGNAPNSILPFVMSLVLHKIGLKKAIFILTFMLAVGNAIQAFSADIGGGWDTTTTFVIFLIGRFIFYIGDDSLLVAKNTLISKWFIGKELAFALGCTQSFERLGSTFAGWVIPPLYSVHETLFLPLIILVVMSTFSWLTSIIIGWANQKDDRQQRELKQYNNQIELLEQKLEDNTSDTTENTEQNSEDQEESKVVTFKDIKQLPLIYWLVASSLLSMFISYQIFYNQSTDFFVQVYGLEKNHVPKITTIPSLMSAIGVPIVGIIVDKIGYRQYFMAAASVICNIGLAFFMFGPECHNKDETCATWKYLTPNIILGIYKILSLASTFPCVPLVLPKKLVPVGFGTILALSNMLLILGNLGGGQVVASTPADKKDGFLYLLIFCQFIASISLVTTSVLIYQNKKNYNNIIGRSKLQQEEVNKQMENTQRGSSIISLESSTENLQKRQQELQDE